MAGHFDRPVEHLLRRAGFGATPDELNVFGQLTPAEAIDYLVDYERVPDDVDDKIFRSGYVGVTARGPFMPWANIEDARQRWLFRMVHSARPLQEKMTLFWHNHFATGYTKVAGALGQAEGTAAMAGKASESPTRVNGQIEMLRANALGNFRDILINIAKDTAMLIWLDGNTNFRAKPQENFAREIMELFTMGVGYYTESDVYAGARVFTGWNTRRVAVTDGASRLEFFYNPAQHDTNSKVFSFPVYSNGSNTIAARSANDGMQDGIDLINALAGNPNTARYLAGKLYRFFVSEAGDPDPAFVTRIAATYLQSGYDMAAVLREVLMSPQFWDSGAIVARYAWPVEFVVRAMKDIGFVGFSVDTARIALPAMQQVLFEPPDVAGWDAGRTWFSTGAMLTRMNFASQLAANQRFNLARTAKPYSDTPDAFLSYFLEALETAPLDRTVLIELGNYLRTTGAWTGSDAQLQTKSSGLVHLIAGLPEYQFV